MKVTVTEQGILVPKSLLEGIQEVEIRKQNGTIVIVPIVQEGPIFQLGKDLISDTVTDASVNHDRYL
jgi:virulence-associated protein VagC